MKITIDRDGCIECGSCEATCADVFILPAGEKAAVVEKFRVNNKPEEGEVGADMVKCAKEAADSCPVTVITVK